MNRYLRLFITLIFIAYIILLVSVLFLRYGREFDFSVLSINERLDTSANLSPMRTVKNYLRALELGNISIGIVTLNIFGNLVLFLPMGALLPVLTKLRGFVKVMFTVLLMILAVECLQLITGLGRFDVDDLILNFTGAVIGYLIYTRSKNEKRDRR